jgi:hypothetical protein
LFADGSGRLLLTHAQQLLDPLRPESGVDAQLLHQE